MSKHTPGPWSYEGVPGWANSWYVRNAERQIICSTDVIGRFGGDENARLIAAAPDLLAALQLIETDKDGDGFICVEAMNLVRAAIAKATGGAA